jgi:hypothetical protein
MMLVSGSHVLQSVNGAVSKACTQLPVAAFVARSFTHLLLNAGENVLKNTGLGYTVIRAGPLLEEPGGYKALIFDQV